MDCWWCFHDATGDHKYCDFRGILFASCPAFTTPLLQNSSTAISHDTTLSTICIIFLTRRKVKLSTSWKLSKSTNWPIQLERASGLAWFVFFNLLHEKQILPQNINFKHQRNTDLIEQNGLNNQTPPTQWYLLIWEQFAEYAPLFSSMATTEQLRHSTLGTLALHKSTYNHSLLPVQGFKPEIPWNNL